MGNSGTSGSIPAYKDILRREVRQKADLGPEHRKLVILSGGQSGEEVT